MKVSFPAHSPTHVTHFPADVQRPLRREAAPAAAVSVRCVASCGASSRVLPTRRPEVKKRPLHDLSLPATHPTPIDDISTGAPAHIRAGGWIVKTLRHLYILIISVDTAVAHVAGAMDKPTWLMLQHNADFRWLRGRSDTPWYPNMSLIRQQKLGDWPSAVNQLQERLQQLLG